MRRKAIAMGMIRTAWMAPAVVLGLVILTLMPLGPAIGQTTTPAEPQGTVLLAPLIQTTLPYVIEFIMAGIFALLGLIAVWFKKKTGLDAEAALATIEARHRDALQTAIKTAVAGVLVKHAGATFDVRSETLAQIVRYLRDSVPDALEHFKPSEKVIATIATAKAVELAAPVQIGTASTSPVDQPPAYK